MLKEHLFLKQRAKISRNIEDVHRFEKDSGSFILWDLDCAK